MLMWMSMDILIWFDWIVVDILSKGENLIYHIMKCEFLILDVCLFP